MPKYCSAPWDTINIHSEGMVGSCLCNSWSDIGWIGNINQNSIAEIYVDKPINILRNSILDQTFSYCRKDQCGAFWNLAQIDPLPNNDITLPSTIHLHLDRNCNLKCKSCRNTNIYSSEVNPKVYNILTKLSNDYQTHQNKVRIYGDGYGDIFASTAYQKWFNNDRIPKCFEFCITTNGNLITKNMGLLEKFKSQIDIVIVSLDAATNQTYKDVRGGNFELVLEGIKQMVKLGIKVSTQYVVQYKNYKEILDYVVLAKSLGVGHIGLQKIDRWGHMADFWWNENQIDNNLNVDYEFLLDALSKLQKDTQVGLCGGLKNLMYTTSTLN
jgi:sulfatase maturation enzyme AslB (radical SAM superfamily)